MPDLRPPTLENFQGKSFDGWVVDSKIDEGNTAVVFHAGKGSDEAAVKIYKPEFLKQTGDAEYERVERQKDLIGHSHPSLVQILSTGEKNGYLYVVMQYVKGRTLDYVSGDVPVYRIKAILAQVASAARYLEERGVVHRDIKPTNIVVDDEYRSATLLDLGVIRPILANTEATSPAGPFLGTLRYSPPEVLSGEDIPPEAFKALTFYQLGGVLHDLITGDRLFGFLQKEHDYKKAVRTIRERKPDLGPESIRRDVPPELVDLARRCLEKSWQERLDKVGWEDFERALFVRRPVVVFLYTGGTIGASADSVETSIRNLRVIRSKDDELLKAFKRRIVTDYEQLAGPGSPMPFDLEWDFLPPDQQLLSENASYRTWEHLGEAVEKICMEYAPRNKPVPDLEGQYLAGIVILHGTDTLAYSAAALSLSLRNLPCPVVLTGSNQPPNEERIGENRLITSKSDAWRNVRNSVQFIQTFGHRFTEVFVCFNDTVHVAANLRKSTIDRSAQSLRERDMLEEPYFYRNYGPARQYAYKRIDGLYCNNLYPLSEALTYDVLIEDSRNKYRHIRQSPWSPKEPLQRSRFDRGVKLIPAAPVSLLQERRPPVPSRMERILRFFGRGEESLDFKVLLIEGYNSGTFATDDDHPFAAQLRAGERHAIPVVLVARDGLVPSLHQYAMEKIGGVEMPVLRLFGLIAETAAPLLSMILAKIPDEEWNAPIRPTMGLLESRHDRLRRAIAKVVEEGGILGAIVGNPIDENGQHEARLEELRLRNSEHKQLVSDLFTQARDEIRIRSAKRPKPRPKPRGRRMFRSGITVLGRQHFLWMLSEVVHVFATASSAPDGLAFLNQLGFDWGTHVRESLLPQSLKSDKLFARQPASVQDALRQSAREQIVEITRYLFDNGVAHVLSPVAPVITTPTEEKSHSDGRVVLDVRTKKHSPAGRDDELFAALGQRSEEEEFFRRLREGGRLTRDAGECKADIENEFDELFKDAFNKRVSPLDWFLIGTYKALVCGLLRDLRFDPWVARCDRHSQLAAVEALRESVHTEVRTADEHMLDLRFSYAGRLSSD